MIAQAPAYKIGSQDLLAINVDELEELQVQRRVDSTGQIQLPYVGNLVAEGLTESELAAEIDRRLEAQYLRKATVSVAVVEYRSRTVTVNGAVDKPGEYGFGRGWFLTDALTAAGGLSKGAETIEIERGSENGLTDRLEIPTDRLVGPAAERWNVPMQQGDVITVEAAQATSIFVLGEASTKGEMRFEPGERVTLLYAVAKMGGLPERASPKITIRRRAETGAVREIAVNFKRILRGNEPDVDLVDGDILVIKESFF